MKDLVRKFSRPGNIMMDFSIGTRSTAKACMLGNQHRTFVGCAMDSELPTAAEADHKLTSVSQMLEPKPDISGSAEMMPADRVFKDKVGAVLASRKTTVGEFTPGMLQK